MADDFLLDRTDGGGAVPLDLGVLLRTRALVQASSGGGESYLLRYVLERTAGRVPHLVIDPEGEFVTLRERHPYVVVGGGGDVAARVETAGPLARALVEARASAVLDLYALRLGERRQFVRAFLEGLLSLPLWRPALVVIDEAHRLAAPSLRGRAGAGRGRGREPGRGRDALHAGAEAGAGGRARDAAALEAAQGRRGRASERVRRADGAGRGREAFGRRARAGPRGAG